MRVQTNSRMLSILEEWNVAVDSPPHLTDVSLVDSLPAALYEYDGLYTIRSKRPTPEAIARNQHESGYEWSANHVHIEDYVGRTPDLSVMQKVGICYAHKLAGKLTSEFADIPFKVLVSFSWGDFPSCVVRFYRIRPGQDCIIEDLDGYREEAIMVIDVGP